MKEIFQRGKYMSVEKKFKRYYSEYIQMHKKNNFDLFTLTNTAIKICNGKMRIK